jgi:hypothetical protein
MKNSAWKSMEECCLLAHIFSLPHRHSRSSGLMFVDRRGSQMNSMLSSAARSVVV